jgi:hypothetical protein
MPIIQSLLFGKDIRHCGEMGYNIHLSAKYARAEGDWQPTMAGLGG